MARFFPAGGGGGGGGGGGASVGTFGTFDGNVTYPPNSLVGLDGVLYTNDDAVVPGSTPPSLVGFTSSGQGAGGFGYINFALPAGSAAGDLAFLFTSSGFPATITGWTTLESAIGSTGDYQAKLFTQYKILDAGDISAGQIVTEMAGSSAMLRVYSAAQVPVSFASDAPAAIGAGASIGRLGIPVSDGDYVVSAWALASNNGGSFTPDTIAAGGEPGTAEAVSVRGYVRAAGVDSIASADGTSDTAPAVTNSASTAGIARTSLILPLAEGAFVPGDWRVVLDTN